MLKLEKINKKVGKFSLRDIDFAVKKGDYFILIGESGAGKSILLEIITGLLTPDSGNIILNGINILNVPPQKRNIGIVYQKPTLFPHMSVFENIAYPYRIKKYTKEEIKIKVQKLAEDTEIEHILKRRIGNLSGGEVQRVTIARTLATNPDVLLLDEPLSFLDVQLKRGMLSLLRKLNQKGQTIVHVTHDYDEALALANQIAIIEKGKIIQSGTPREIFQNPRSIFVANFIGIKNFLKGRLSPSGQGSEVKIFETSAIEISTTSNDDVGSEGFVIIPVEKIVVSQEKLDSNIANNFKGYIKDIYQTKFGFEVVIDIGIELSAQISYSTMESLKITIGKCVWICINTDSVKFVRT